MLLHFERIVQDVIIDLYLICISFNYIKCREIPFSFFFSFLQHHNLHWAFLLFFFEKNVKYHRINSSVFSKIKIHVSFARYLASLYYYYCLTLGKSLPSIHFKIHYQNTSIVHEFPLFFPAISDPHNIAEKKKET